MMFSITTSRTTKNGISKKNQKVILSAMKSILFLETCMCLGNKFLPPSDTEIVDMANDYYFREVCMT